MVTSNLKNGSKLFKKKKKIKQISETIIIIFAIFYSCLTKYKLPKHMVCKCFLTFDDPVMTIRNI